MKLIITSAIAFFLFTNVNAQIISTFAGTNEYRFHGDDVIATNAYLYEPNGVAVDDAGNIYIADILNNRIRKVTASTGKISTIAGNGTYGSSGDGGLAINAILSGPVDLTVDKFGNIYFADNDHNCVRKIDGSTGIINTIAGTNGTAGFTGDGGLAINALLYWPRFVKIDRNGNLFISDNGNNRIRKIGTNTGLISTVVGNGNTPPFVNGMGFASSTGDGGLAIDAPIVNPWFISIDSHGDIYFSELGCHTVRKVDMRTGIINTIVGTGIEGYSGDGGIAVNAQLEYPGGLAIDQFDNLYISDVGNYRIRKVDKLTGYINTYVGDGAAGYWGDGGQALNSKISTPQGLCTDVNGNLFIAETAYRSIRKVNSATGIITTVAGVSIFDTNGGLATKAQLSGPSVLKFNSKGDLFSFY